jgi:hypothetical protein
MLAGLEDQFGTAEAEGVRPMMYAIDAGANASA